MNGAPGRVRVDPAAPGPPLVTQDYATRAKVRSGMIGVSLGYNVGSEHVMHRTGTATLDAGTGPFKRRVGWGTRPYAAVADGTIGPGALPEPVIRFVLHPAQPGERTVALPMTDGGGLFGGFSGLFAVIRVDGVPIRVRFDPYHPHTLATAGAAQRIAAAQGGRLTGETRTTEIAFGIARPVRTMLLARPLAIGPLTLASLGVRTRDMGNADSIPDAAADPDEIVVTAKTKRDPSRDRIALGADQLARCSSIVFDKPARQIRLTCG